MSSPENAYHYSNLSVHLRKREDQGTFEVGVEVNGVFHPIYVGKLGRLSKLESRAAEHQQQSQQPQQ